MDGFKRPARPSRPTPQPAQPRKPELALPAPRPELALPPAAQPLSHQLPTDTTKAPLTLGRTTKRRWALWSGGTIIALILLIGVVYAWYIHALTPVNSHDGTIQQVQVTKDTSFSYVSGRLQERKLIRSSLALQIYARLHGETGNLKQGACNLSPKESAPEILQKLTSGCHDFKSVTFYPGATIEPSKNLKPGAKDFSVRGSLRAAGFSDADITAALTANYDSPLFAGRPVGASLEGYVYGDTYYINVDAGPEQALQDSFSEMEKAIEKDNLVALYKAHGLSLFQGITLASIIQRELSCDNLDATHQATCYENQQKIAQVFYTRMAQGMTLGSDVTFIYAAGLTGETASPTIDSPYNTRIHTGLTPGPIASPSEFALKAAGNPASTDYLYFIAGDEGGGAMYFAHTDAEHEQNIKDHCQVLCS